MTSRTAAAAGALVAAMLALAGCGSDSGTTAAGAAQRRRPHARPGRHHAEPGGVDQPAGAGRR